MKRLIKNATGLFIVSSLAACNGGNTYNKNSETTQEAETREQTVTKLPASVDATFCLAPQAGNSYDASNLIDGDSHTAWAVPLDKGGIDADVIDWLVFHLDARHISSIVITNGYAKDAKSYGNNARGRSITISRAPWEEADDDDILYDGQLLDTSDPQKLIVSDTFDNSKPTETIYIKFSTDYYKGAKYNDFCISEIEFYGY